MMASNVKAITQATFDCVVQENINDFEMEETEAINDAVEQFTSQGVNLNMIIKEVASEEGHRVVVLVKKLENTINGTDVSDENIKELLISLSTLFQNDLANRYQASKIANADQVLYKTCLIYKDDKAMLKYCLITFTSLLEGQPDLISTQGIDFIIQLLQDVDDVDLATLLLRVIRLSCTKHEENRVYLVKSNGIEAILKTAEKFKECPSTIREVCGSLRTLTLDDDVRVPFGKAHDHTKLIVMEHSGLERLFQFIPVHEEDSLVTSDLYLTMGKLMVRSEFCQQMVDLGGLEVISRTINVHIEKQNVVRQCVMLLKAISGNDDVKIAVVKVGGIDLLLKSLNKHKSNPQICEACFAAITMLALRNPSHCDVIMSKNAAPLMTQAMKEHCDHSGVQKQACMAIRNLVARTRHHSKAFIEHGAETLIRKARLQHKQVLDDESKAALRDLDVDVELKEIWRGKNPGITS